LLISGNGTRRSYLPAVGLLAVGAIVWFGLNQSAPYGPLVLGWIAPPTALAVSALAVHRTASMAGLPAGARRFWNGIAIVCVSSAVGLVLQAVYALTGHGQTGGKVPPPVGLLYLFGVGYTVWVLLRIPIGSRSRSEWARLWLDIATVMLGTAVLMWYVGFSPLLTHGSPHVVWVPLSVGVVCLAGVLRPSRSCSPVPGRLTRGRCGCSARIWWWAGSARAPRRWWPISRTSSPLRCPCR